VVAFAVVHGCLPPFYTFLRFAITCRHLLCAFLPLPPVPPHHLASSYAPPPAFFRGAVPWFLRISPLDGQQHFGGTVYGFADMVTRMRWRLCFALPLSSAGWRLTVLRYNITFFMLSPYSVLSFAPGISRTLNASRALRHSATCHAVSWVCLAADAAGFAGCLLPLPSACIACFAAAQLLLLLPHTCCTISHDVLGCLTANNVLR